MTQGDVDSYYLYKGFIEESIRLSENKTNLENDQNMKVESIERKFKGVQNLISRPVHRVMMIQRRMVSKRTEQMKEFKIVGTLGEIFTDVPERLIHVNGIDEHLMHFVLMSAWPLTRMDIIHEVPGILSHYEALSDAYHDNDWELMGVEAAQIAHIIHEDQKKVRGEDYVEKEDDREMNSDHEWIGIDE